MNAISKKQNRNAYAAAAGFACPALTAATIVIRSFIVRHSQSMKASVFWKE